MPPALFDGDPTGDVFGDPIGDAIGELVSVYFLMTCISLVS